MSSQNESSSLKLLGLVSMVIGLPMLIQVIAVLLIIVVVCGAVFIFFNENLHLPSDTYFPIPEGFEYNYSNDWHAPRPNGRKHMGNDIMAKEGVPIVAMKAGFVEKIGWNNLGGWRIGIRTKDDEYWFYAHLRKVNPYGQGIKKGVQVQAGQVIGYNGSTGYSTNIPNDSMPPNSRAVDGKFVNHLHLGLYIDGKAVNPYPMLQELEKNKQFVKVKKFGEHYKTVGYKEVPISGFEGAFINKVADGHKKSKIYEKYKIYNSVSIAQAILESNWGRSSLTRIANNLFGIKADSSWKGAKITVSTQEYHGEWETIEDDFRLYNSWQESIDDHAKFLKQHKRYENNGVFAAKNYVEQAKALQKAKYATDPNYANKLVDLIKKYNLHKYD